MERILGNCNQKPMLIYFYQSTDPVMNSVGNWLETNSKEKNVLYFKNRFTSVYVFPVDKFNLVKSSLLTKKSLCENINTILKLETSFNKIMFAIDCHGSKSFMCTHLSEDWFEFFTNSKSQTHSQLALITTSCNSCDFFYKTITQVCEFKSNCNYQIGD